MYMFIPRTLVANECCVANLTEGGAFMYLEAIKVSCFQWTAPLAGRRSPAGSYGEAVWLYTWYVRVRVPFALRSVFMYIGETASDTKVRLLAPDKYST